MNNKSKHNRLNRSFFLSYMKFFILIIISVLIIDSIAFISTKKALTELGETALKNRIQMGLAMMSGLDKQVQKGVITKAEAEEIFKSEMLNPKQKDGKTRGENSKLELNIKAYMYAIDSKGVEQMHPFKEGEDISQLKDAKGNNIVEMIIEEGNNPKNRGIINFWWKNPEDTYEKPKVNAVGYFKPWDWYINVGCYNEDFYRPAYYILTYIVIVSIIIMFATMLFIINFMKKKINPLSNVVNSMELASNGNMQAKVPIKAKDEMGYIGEVFNKMIEEITNILSNIKEISGAVNEKTSLIKNSTTVTVESSNSIKEVMEEISKAINDTVKKIENSFQSIQVLSNNINIIKENSLNMKIEAEKANGLNSNVISILNHLESNTEKSIVVSKETNKSISELVNKSKTILGIISTIDQISNQIKMLALNASIESARAGEVGKGFAVVAEQIKKLSFETAGSVKQINKLITELIDVINKSVDNVEKSEGTAKSQIETINETKGTLKEVVIFMERLSIMIKDNVGLIDDVYESKEVVSNSMDSVLSVAEEISASSEEISASTSEVKEKMDYIKNKTEELNNFTRELNIKLNHFST